MGVFDQLGDLLDMHEGQKVLQTLSVLFEQEGGLNQLLEKFQSAGLHSTIQSWVEIGENQPITAEQVQSVLGQEKIQALAEKLGIECSAMAGNLVHILPRAIDKFTPGGKLDQSSDFLQHGLYFFKGKFFN